jgi:hypothetical protein
MSATVETVSGSKSGIVTGYIITGLPALFLLLDGVMKLFKPPFVVEATARLGYSENTIVPLGITLVACTILYLIPRTSVIGAILLTGYLGGAVATHVRFFEGAFPVVFPVIIGTLVWAGLYLRDPRLRTLLPLRQ